MGRPTDFNQEVASLICERLVEGESLRAICRDEAMPAIRTVFKWLAADEVFVHQYALARDAQADTLADEIIEISDDGTNDWMERKSRDGEAIGWQENGEAIGRSRLRVDARKWIASKLKPKKYGEKVDLMHANPDGSNLAPPVITFGFGNGGPGEPSSSV